MVDFYELPYGQVEESQLISNGALNIVRALHRDPDVELIEVGLGSVTDNKRVEYIVCDINCHEVPSKNKVGIEFSERIAYQFIEGRNCPNTLALRADFPFTMHQNDVGEESYKDLCLYEETFDVVDISWTAERHIKRTRWWLEKAAREELHSTQQPVEQLFFTPSSSIVLPYDFNERGPFDRVLKAIAINRNSSSQSEICVVTKWHDDPNVSDWEGHSLNVIDVETKEIVHGMISTAPRNMHSLVSSMGSLQVDIIELIRNRLLEVDQKKVIYDLNAPLVIVIRLPIKREVRGPVESFQTISIMASNTLQELFYSFEIIVKGIGGLNIALDGTLLPMSQPIPNLALTPIETLLETTPEGRRWQSGTANNLQQGTIVGGGALGSALIDIWAKSGWGKWNVIDGDYMRPHNFTRHMLTSWATGQNKASAIENSYNSFFSGKLFKGIVANATDFEHKEIKDSYQSSQIVIDASASLTYPRAVSKISNCPRHASAFFTPTGTDSVLLVEDTKRKIRLNSLEAQYYRAIIEKEFGETHLISKLKTFRSGVSCRDVSTVLSQGRVISCAALLAEQIQRAHGSEEAAIHVWQENKVTSERQYFPIVVYETCTNNKELTTLNVFWDKGIELKLYKLRKEAIPNETGGILIGYHDFVNKQAFIVDAIPAPPDSVGTPTSFQRGEMGVRAFVEKVVAKTAGNVSYIGEWHSHPDGISANKSQLDEAQLSKLASDLSDDGIPGYQMIISNNEIKVYEGNIDGD